MFCTCRVLGSAIGAATLLLGAMVSAQAIKGPPHPQEAPPAVGDRSGAGAEAPSHDKTAEPAAKIAPPTAADMEIAAKLVRGVYGEEYAKAKDADSKAKFAARLLDEARATRDDPTARFVMMKIAKDILVQLVDVRGGPAGTVNEMAKIYQVDARQDETGDSRQSG